MRCQTEGAAGNHLRPETLNIGRSPNSVLRDHLHLLADVEGTFYQSSFYVSGMPLFSNVPALRLVLAYAIHDPASLLPHATIPTLLYLPIPVSSALPSTQSGRKPVVRALVLDKDNTICPPETAELHAAYRAKIEQLKASAEFSHSRHSILVVSNTAGSSSSQKHEEEAVLLEKELGVPVLRQSPGRKKPLCAPDVLKFFEEHGVTEDPAEIVFVGDRLATDVLLAREAGSWSFWCRDGWRNPEMPGVNYNGFWNKLEIKLEKFLRSYGKIAPMPTAQDYIAKS